MGVKGNTRIEINDANGDLVCVLIGATEAQAKEHMNNPKFCPPGCTMNVGKCRGRC